MPKTSALKNNITARDFSQTIKHNPLIIHINLLGLFRMAPNNRERFLKFNVLLNEIQDFGGNIAIPTYSYTYTKNEIYDVLYTPSELCTLSEYLRVNNKEKRTVDANFSYLLFGNNFSKRHFKVSDLSSFGEKSLVEDVFNQDGYLGAVGGALEYMTEIHFLERKLEVEYRFDKVFPGTSVDKNNNKIDNKITYFCRDLHSDYSVSFVQLKTDIRNEGLVKTWNIEKFDIVIEVVKIQDLFDFIKNKISIYPKYLWQ